MNNIIKIILSTTITLGAFFICQNTFAACTGSSPTWTSSADQTSVATCVSNATAGDTINVSAGSATWAGNAIAIPANKPLNIIGAGSGVLTITLGGHNAFTIGPYTGTEQLPATRISGFKFYSPTNAMYTAIVAQGQGWRIDNCAYESVQPGSSASTALFVNAHGYNTPTEPMGLIDHCTIINGKVFTGSLGNEADESALWSANLELGSAKAVYVENCTFTNNGMIQSLAIDAQYGGRYVFRYNTLVGYWVLAHGSYGGGRGVKNWEIYGNTFNTTDYTSMYSVINALSGTGMVYYNSITMYGNSVGAAIEFNNERSTFNDATFGGLCDGDAFADQNDDATGWLCSDQVGAGKDASTWAYPYSSNPRPVQARAPVYLWANRDRTSVGNIGVNVVATAQKHIKPNRDYYTTAASFNGTSGVGCGTLANRPGTCTTGVGYWATDQSCSDLTDYVGASPTTPISGTLYKCTATNTWTAYYTPYTYPHPLRGAEDILNPTATWAIDATGLIATGIFSETVNATAKTGVSFTGSVTGAITATYKDGMPGGIVRYDLNKEVQQGETVTVDYTTPGDGIKDLAGNALADISGGAVSNGSTQSTPPLVTMTIGSHTGATVNIYPGINCGSTCGPVEYDNGTVLSVNVTALPNYTGCTIGGTGCGASTTMSENRTCTVSCTKQNADAKVGTGAGHKIGAGNPAHKRY